MGRLLTPEQEGAMVIRKSIALWTMAAITVAMATLGTVVAQGVYTQTLRGFEVIVWSKMEASILLERLLERHVEDLEKRKPPISPCDFGNNPLCRNWETPVVPCDPVSPLCDVWA
jgi:hypothetical protein